MARYGFLLLIIVDLLGCAGTAREARFHDGIWSGAWNSADARHIADELKEVLQEKGLTCASTSKLQVTMDPRIRGASLAEALTSIFTGTSACSLQASVIQIDSTANKPWRYQITIQVQDAKGIEALLMDRLIEKDRIP